MREYARRHGLPVADKPDSHEICFVPDNDYAAFVQQRAPDAAVHDDVIVDQGGRVLARHGGIHRFTVGQRKGLGLPSSPTGAPMYVLALSPADHQVVVGPKSALERTVLTASDVNWIVEEPRTTLTRDRADSPSSPRGAGDGAARSETPASRSPSTRRRSPSRPGRRWSCTTEIVVLGGGWIE